MNIRDANRIVVINKHCDEIIEVLNKHKYSKDEFYKDIEYKNSLLFSLLQIGECANSLTSDFIMNHKDFSVHKMVATRNVIVHGYEKIRMDEIWQTCINDIPKLKKTVIKLANEYSIELDYGYPIL